MITCEHLTIHTDAALKQPTLRDVSTRVERGKVRAFVGHQGSGKSTLGRALVGLLDGNVRRAVGRVRIGDRLVSLRRGGQNPHLRAAWFGPAREAEAGQWMSVREMLAEAVADRFPAEVFDDLTLIVALARVGLNDERLLDAQPADLPAARLRRVYLARALARPVSVQAPDLIVLDEPLAGLDASAAQEVLVALTGMRRVIRASVVVLTRDLALAKEYADEISVLEGGRLVETFNTERLRAAEAAHARVAVQPRTTPPRQRAETSRPKQPAAKIRRENGSETVALELRNFSVLQPEGNTVTAPISVTVRAGEGLAITGPLGSGKSTIARALVGAIHPSSALRISGDLLLGGVLQAPRVSARTLEQRRAIQLVAHDPERSPNDSHTVRTQLRRAVRRVRPQASSRAISARVAELLGVVGLDEAVLLERTGDLQLEQGQRVALARALAHEPQVLVCDDPGEGVASREFLDMLAQLRARTGVALVMITRSSEIARYTCDRELHLQGDREYELHSFRVAERQAA